ncbi:MAG: TerC family protein [Methylovirgula sp.]
MTIDLPALLTPVLQIIWIDIVLSGDNAIVIGLACRNLPEKQRLLGIGLGTGAAVILRALLTIVVVELLQLPLVRLVGGLLLLWIAIKLVLEQNHEKDVAPAESIFAVIRIIVIADAVMSLDNVMAIAAAAKGSILLVLFGLGLSVPLIIFGSTLLLGLFSRFPILVWAGAALLGYVGGELIADERLLDPVAFAHSEYFELGCGAAGVIIVVGIAWLLRHFAQSGKAPDKTI